MKKINLAVVLLLISSVASAAGSGTTMAISTQELAGVCGDQSNSQPQTYCDIYGQGVFDGYLVTRHPKQAPDFICVEQPAPTRREVMKEFVDWVKRNPIYNSAPAADSLLRFLANKFPCESSMKSPENAVNKIIR